MRITLANLAEATEQQVFDQVAKHLLQQGARSAVDNGCKYRSEGRSCAAGCLIDDSEYRLVFEDNTWGTLVKIGDVPDTHSDLISKLQEIHDNSQVSEWPELLESLAEIKGLNTEVLCESH